MKFTDDQLESLIDLMHALNSAETVGLHLWISDKSILSVSLTPAIEMLPEPEHFVIVPVPTATAKGSKWAAVPSDYLS